MIENDESRIMSIDYGSKRIGIALSDPLKTFAYSFTTINNDDKKFLELEKIIREKFIIKIILGIPNEQKASKNSVVEEVKKFKSELENKFNLTVMLWDETYTSVIAKQQIIQSVKGKMKRRDKSLLDMNSAAIILQEYLDSLNK